ncbi:MAG: general secretion pathway protein M [Alteromonadaceae bacterium]|jgi:general secretion pathway protein M
MKIWWQQLNLREKKLVVAMTSLVVIFILYSFIWQPLNDNIAKTEKKIARQQQLLSWVAENTQRFQQAKSNVGNQVSGSLSSIVNRTAGSNKITITRMQPQGDNIQVWIDEIAFNQLLQWLEQLSSQEGLQVTNIDLSDAGKPGVVRVRRLQLGTN